MKPRTKARRVSIYPTACSIRIIDKSVNSQRDSFFRPFPAQGKLYCFTLARQFCSSTAARLEKVLKTISLTLSIPGVYSDILHWPASVYFSCQGDTYGGQVLNIKGYGHDFYGAGAPSRSSFYFRHIKHTKERTFKPASQTH